MRIPDRQRPRRAWSYYIEEFVLCAAVSLRYHFKNELTPREGEILEGLAAGLSNKEIGETLFLSEKTVKHYMTNILQKLQVHNRVEAALLAQKEMKKS